MKKAFLSSSLSFLVVFLTAQQHHAGTFVPKSEEIEVESGPHHRISKRVWEKVNDNGGLHLFTNQFVTLATGLNRWDQSTGAWVPAEAFFEVTEEGYIIARHTRHQVILPPDLGGEDPVDFLTPDGTRLLSSPLAIALVDTAGDKDVLIGELKNSQAELVSPSEVIYRNAFRGIRADVRFRLELGLFEADVILREQPVLPKDFDPAATRLEVLTEFYDSPQPLKAAMEDGDQSLIFGEMSMAQGYAFEAAEKLDEDKPHPSRIRVRKQWDTIQGRQFLFEAVEWGEIKPFLRILPEVDAAQASAWEKSEGKIPQLIPKRLVKEKSKAVAGKPLFRKERGNWYLDLASSTLSRHGKKKLAASFPADRSSAGGLVIDYRLVATAGSYTLQGDSTHYVNGALNLSSLTIEGGAVVKYANVSNAKISTASVINRTLPYRPAVFTGVYDNSVGEVIATSSTPPAYYGDTFLELYTYGTTLEHLRFNQANTAIRYAGVSISNNSHTLRHVQILNSHTGIRVEGTTSYPINLFAGNLLMSGLANGFAAQRSSIRTEHTTAHLVGTFATPLSGANASLIVVNSILANITTLNSSGITVSGGYNGFYSSPTFGTSQLTTSVYPFETAGAGNYYLLGSSTFRNSGYSAINSALLAELRKRTTTKPEILDYEVYTSDTIWQKNAALRDTDTLDRGYHYPVLDKLITVLSLKGNGSSVNAPSLTLTPGLAVGFYGYGCFFMTNAPKLCSQGTPLEPVQLCYYNTVQEQPMLLGDQGNGMFYFMGGYEDPEVSLQFTRLDALAAGHPGAIMHLFYTSPSLWNFRRFSARDCSFSAGQMWISMGEGDRFVLNNNVFHRSTLVFWTPGDFWAFNNLFYGTTIDMFLTQSEGWAFKDNIFDRVNFTPNSPPVLNHSHNAYVGVGAERFSPAQSSDKILSNLAYTTSSNFWFYQPTSSPLLNAGSVTAEARGLNAYTAVRDTASTDTGVVDIGPHFASLNSLWQPIDLNNDSTPDFSLNAVPTVDAGSSFSTTETTFYLNGNVFDDGKGCSDFVQIMWTKIGGPGSATFSDPQMEDTHVNVSYPGTYEFQLSANDALSTATDTVQVMINFPGPPPQNLPPVVNAGRDQSIQKPSSLTPLVSSVSLSPNVRNNHSGWVGMKFIVGPEPILVSELGRWVRSGNSGAHGVKLVAANGVDLPGGQVTVNTAGAPAGQFKYASLSTPITLEANTAYLLVSQETNGGDSWHDYSSQLVTSGAATIPSAVFNWGSAPYTTYGLANQCYGPVNLRYTGSAKMVLEGIVTDDGLPSDSVSTTWSVVSKPNGATFHASDLNSPTPTAYFSHTGRYVLRLTGYDGFQDEMDDVTIRVYAHERRPKDVMLVADISEWMGDGGEIGFPQSWARQFASFLENPKDRVGLILLTDTGYLQHTLSSDLGLVVQATEKNVTSKDVVSYASGIKLAQLELTGSRKNEMSDKFILFFSNGDVNGSLEERALAKPISQSAKADAITIIPVGLFPNDLPEDKTERLANLAEIASDPSYIPQIHDTTISISPQTEEKYNQILDKIILGVEFDKKRFDVSAGKEKSIGPNSGTSLNALVNGNVGSSTFSWSKLIGPDSGAVTFSPNGTTGSHSTTATFNNVEGQYVIRLTVTDSATPTPLTVYDDLIINVTTKPVSDYVVVNKGSSGNLINIFDNDLVPLDIIVLLEQNSVFVGNNSEAIVENDHNDDPRTVRYTPDPNLGGALHKFWYELENNEYGDLWILVDPINEPPLARDDDNPSVFAFSPDNNEYSLTTFGRNILSQDYDPDFAENSENGLYPIFLESVGPLTGISENTGLGTLTLHGPYDLQYRTPSKPDFNDILSFNYTVRDTYGRRSTATTKIYVSPGVNENRYLAQDDVAVISAFEAYKDIYVLANDYDVIHETPVDIGNLTSVNPSSAGSAAILSGPPEKVRFTVSSRANAAKFSYKIFDTTRPEHQATVYIGFSPDGVNSKPVGALTAIDGKAFGYVEPPLIRKGIVEITGSTTDPDPGAVISYSLEVLDGDNILFSKEYNTFGISSGILGEVDFRGIPDGIYQIRLTLRDEGPDSPLDEEYSENVLVRSDVKLGRLEFEIQDVQVPVAELPLLLSRKYDSSDGVGGEFGPGWRLAISGAKLIKSDVLGTPWAKTGNCAYDDGRQSVVVDLGNGERFLFSPRLDNCVNSVADGILFTPGTLGSELTITEPDIPAQVSTIFNSVENYMEVFEDQADPPFDPEHFLFTHPSGTKFKFEHSELKFIEDRNGNRLTIDLDSATPTIEYDAAGAGLTKTLLITKTSEGLITAVFAPSEVGSTVPTIKYEYIEIGGIKYLSKVHRLIEKPSAGAAKYETASYTYLIQDPLHANTTHPHYITHIRDDVGPVSRYEYDSEGRLKVSVDGKGNKTTFDYHDDLASLLMPTAKGRQTVTDALGNKTVFEYDANGNVVLTQDPEGNDTTHEYGYNNDRIVLDTVTTWKGAFSANIIAQGPITNKYTYHNNSEVVASRSVTIPGNITTTETYNLYGQIEASSDGNGNLTEYFYVDGTETPSTDYVNAKGKLKEIVHPFEGSIPVKTTYKYPANQIIEIDPLQNRTTSQLDPNFGYVVSVLREDSALVDLNHVTYQYDANARLEKEKTRRKVGTVWEELCKTFNYDWQGRLLSTETTKQNFPSLIGTTPLSSQISIPNPFPTFTYTARGQVKTEERQRTLLSGATEIQTTTFEYDPTGRMIRKTHPDGEFEEWTYTTGNRLDRYLDRGGRTTEYRYDTLNRVIETILPDKTSRKTEYDSAGRVSVSIDERGSKTAFGYNTAGRRSSVTNALGHVTKYTYDGVGNISTVTDSLNHVTTHYYNKQNQLKRVVYPDSAIERNYGYNAAGQKVSETDPEGVVTQFGYDGLGRLIEVKLASGLVDETVTTYTYDEAGNLVTQEDAQSVNGNRVTKFEYDPFGRREKRTLPAGGFYEQFTYNELGNVKSRRNFNGKITQFEYDKMNRLVQKKPDSTLGAWDPITFTYTPSGQRASMKYPVAVGPGNSEMVTYHYDSRDRLTKKVSPQGAIKYTYDDLRGAQTVETFHNSTAPTLRLTYEFDPLNRVTRVINQSLGSSLVTAYNYNENGNLTSQVLPNNVRVQHGYDTMGRLKLVEHLPGAAGAGLASFSYGLGKSGVRTTLNEYVSGGISRTLTYFYDKLYRLGEESITGTSPVGTITYDAVSGYGDSTGYDKVGNRRVRDSTIPGVADNRAYSYDPNDRLTSNLGAGKVSATYDANGNTLRADINANAAWDFTSNDLYDFEDRLVTAVRTAGTISMVYDGDGNRIRKTVSGTTTHYLVDNRNPTGYAQVLEESTTLNGQPNVMYVYGLDLINQHRKVGAAWETDYYGYDGHGSARFLTTESGAISERYTYDAFGNLLGSPGATPNKYLYAGEQWDSHLGMYYLRARYYHPELGRFWTKDTYEGNKTDPLSLHQYLYCAADPVNRIDPSGNFSMVGVMSAGSIGNSLQGMYNGVVSVTGNAIQSTLFGIQAGHSANDILSDFVLGETGLGLFVDGYNALRSAFQSPEEAEIAAFMAWKEQLIATIIVAMEDHEFGEITVELVPQCFVAGTPVATEAGLKSIEEIKVGDKVWAWNESTDEVTLRPVLNRFVHRRNEIFEIQVGRDSLKVTGEHPFYVSGKGWTPTRDIRVGDLFVTDDNESLAVERVDKQQGEFLVYNFEVSTDHNYYVGQEGVLTHNANALRRAMRLNNPLLAAHHIVALRAKGAAGARALLLMPGTGIVNLSDIRNGVALPKNLKVKVPGFARATVHSVVHTRKYYLELENRLRAVAPGQRIQVLQQAAHELRIGKFPY